MRIAAVCAAVALAAGLSVVGCATPVPGAPSADPAAVVYPAPAPRPPGAVFRDARGRFDLVPPRGWTVDTTGAQDTAVIFAEPRPAETASGRFRANINVLVVPAGTGLPATVASARRELTALRDYRPTTDEHATLPDGSRAHLLGGTFRDPRTGMALRNVQLLTVRGGETVVATGTARTDTWSAYEAVFETSLRSLTVVT